MMQRRLITLILLAGIAMPASACLLFNRYKYFAPSVPETFQWDHAKLDPSIPKPVLTLERIKRLPFIPADYRQRIEGCKSGTVALRVHWPQDAPYKLKDVGFRFKSLPDIGLPFEEEPIFVEPDGDTMLFEFDLFELPDATRDELVLDIEVYAVNARHERGLASKYVFRAPVAKPD